MKLTSKVIVSAAILCIAIVSLVVFANKGSTGLSANFLRYAVASDGITQVAVLTVTNQTGHSFKMPLASGRSSSGVDEFRVCCQFSEKTATGWTNWTERIGTPSGFTAVTLLPYSSLDVTVPLASAGQRRKVAVLCLPNLRESALTSDKVHLWLLTHLPARYRRMSLTTIWCDRELCSTSQTNATAAVPKP